MPLETSVHALVRKGSPATAIIMLQANAEAVVRHYRLEDPLPAATAITALLSARAGDRPVSPGINPAQPVFPERLRQLRAGVGRGRRSFEARCARCYRPADIAPPTRHSPGLWRDGPQSLEAFLMG